MMNEEKYQEAFKKYLEGKKYYPDTIKQTIRRVNKFAEWLQPQHGWSFEEFENVEYKHLLDYINHEKARGISTGVIHNNISSISHYFEYLNKENNNNLNPARTLRLKGKEKK
ncbi:MAG: phage integrase N-terminal SAM-like domain-containing protein [Chitinophagaceae bacterium]|nr:phage integrase N-terminal SAM-like domain-containing protein [Chitinophagaceae bacterium]